MCESCRRTATPRDLQPLRQSSTLLRNPLLVAARQSHFGPCGPVRAKLVGHQHFGCKALFLEQLTHQLHGCSLVAPSLHEQVENLALIVNRAPQPELSARNHYGQASGAGESHPRALSEPDVTLSRHPAPIVRPRPWIKLQ